MNMFDALVRPIPTSHVMLEQPKKERPKPIARPQRDLSSYIANPWGLSPMQCLVMAGQINGLSRKEIGRLNGISPATVHEHVNRVRTRMGVDTSIHAAVLWDRFVRDGQLQVLI